MRAPNSCPAPAEGLEIQGHCPRRRCSPYHAHRCLCRGLLKEVPLVTDLVAAVLAKPPAAGKHWSTSIHRRRDRRRRWAAGPPQCWSLSRHPPGRCGNAVHGKATKGAPRAGHERRCLNRKHWSCLPAAAQDLLRATRVAQMGRRFCQGGGLKRLASPHCHPCERS